MPYNLRQTLPTQIPLLQKIGCPSGLVAIPRPQPWWQPFDLWHVIATFATSCFFSWASFVDNTAWINKILQGDVVAGRLQEILQQRYDNAYQCRNPIKSFRLKHKLNFMFGIARICLRMQAGHPPANMRLFFWAFGAGRLVRCEQMILYDPLFLRWRKTTVSNKESAIINARNGLQTDAVLRPFPCPHQGWEDKRDLLRSLHAKKKTMPNMGKSVGQAPSHTHLNSEPHFHSNLWNPSTTQYNRMKTPKPSAGREKRWRAFVSPLHRMIGCHKFDGIRGVLCIPGTSLHAYDTNEGHKPGDEPHHLHWYK